MRPLLALLLFTPCTIFAQLPDYVPTNGLVAWYDFAGSLNDISGNENHGVSSTPPSLVVDIELNQSVASFDGINDVITVAAPAQLGNAPQISFAAWLKPSTGQSGQVVSMDSGRLSWFLNSAASNYDVVTGTSWASEDPLFGLDNAPFNHPEGWFHFGFAMTGDSLHVYINGALLESASCLVPTLLETNIIIGYRNMYSTGNYHYEGMMKDLGCWNRPLSAGEFTAIFTASEPLYGCTDANACNFDPQATTEDDSCAYGCNYCGEGTTWDTLTSTCIGANPTDVDLDGCTGVGDVLEVLSLFGECTNEDGTGIDDCIGTYDECGICNGPGIPEGYCDCIGNQLDALGVCGGDCLEDTDNDGICDLSAGPCLNETTVAYNGYDYTIVGVDERCWFAENLRTTAFNDGTPLLGPLSNGDWYLNEIYDNDPAWAVYEEDYAQLNNYGRLYNVATIMSANNVCPIGWHVASDEDFITLEIAAGMSAADADLSGMRGSTGEGQTSGPGYHLKSQSFWANAWFGPPGIGSDSLAFNGLPGGLRRENGTYSFQTTEGRYWTTLSETQVTFRTLINTNDGVGRGVLSPNDSGAAFSIRCVKD